MFFFKEERYPYGKIEMSSIIGVFYINQFHTVQHPDLDFLIICSSYKNLSRGGIGPTICNAEAKNFSTMPNGSFVMVWYNGYILMFLHKKK